MGSGRLLPLLVLGALLLCGGAGYAVWSLDVTRRQALRQLADTAASLTQTQETLTMLEEERRKLSDSYETLKARWASTDQDLQRLTNASAQTAKELASLTSERAELQQRVDNAKREASRLQEQATVLDQERTALAKDKTALTTRVQALSNSAQAQQGALDEAKRALAAQAEADQQLHERMAQLSSAYEQLIREKASLQTALQPQEQPAQGGAESVDAAVREERPRLNWRLALDDTTPREPDGMEKLDDVLHQLRKGAPPRYGEEDKNRADSYQDLGRAYLDVGQYERAADAFERSLTFRDDPDVQRTLALLYRDQLQRPSLARAHAVKSDRAGGALDTSPDDVRPSRLPRKTWPLVFDWLAKP